ncbi:MAG: hypothetical protein J6P30_04285 [Fibrobacter sp.]|nr:hypothetical protein [Fibrobacter sp.]
MKSLIRFLSASSTCLMSSSPIRLAQGRLQRGSVRLVSAFVAALAFGLIACGEETTENVTNINQMGLDVVASVKDLPECTSDNDGSMAFVKKENGTRVCVDGDWVASSDTVFVSSGEISCKTVELSDKSGLKIVCNGDSIGVVLNGEKGDKGDDGAPGANGKDGAPGAKGDKGNDGVNGTNGTNGKDGHDGVGCSIGGQTDSLVTIVCGADTVTVNIGSHSAESEECEEIEAEDCIAPSDEVSLSGVSQKGPFISGTDVTAYELQNGRSLKQTGKTFGGKIENDDGLFNIKTVSLKSNYVYIVADGFYRNEVTGENSGTSIKLRAITNLRNRDMANINLLTHLEYDRVQYLVTVMDSSVLKAKMAAEKEIFSTFNINNSGFKGFAEDFNIFQKGEGNAALLAISILLQGDRSESGLTNLLTNFSIDLRKDGSWDDSTTRAKMADWAMQADTSGKLGTIRGYVKGWGLGDGTVPDFEKYVRTFWSVENGLGVCGSSENPIGTVKHISNPRSEYYAKDYFSADTAGRKLRFICVDADSAKWRVATEIESDKYAWISENGSEPDVNGTLLIGPFTGDTMVWDADTLRYADSSEIAWNIGCVSYYKDTNVVMGVLKSNYTCTSNGWEFDSVNVITDTADGKTYRTIKIGNQYWMAENMSRELTSGSYCYDSKQQNCLIYGRLYTIGAAKTICPERWRLPSNDDWTTLFNAVGGIDGAGRMLKSSYMNGDNRYGFDALPGGYYGPATTGLGVGNSYYNVENQAYFWSSTSSPSDYPYYVLLGKLLNYAQLNVSSSSSAMRLSVRCVMD